MAVQGRSSGRSQEVAFGNIANSLQSAAFQLGAMAGAAQQLYSTLNVFRELEKQLTLTNAIAGGNAETFKQLETAVRNFALGVTFSAAESANALLQLTQAGLSTQEAISAMSGVLTLAAATLEDVNETADLVAATLTSFSLEATQASRISNLFAASMNQSQASLPKLAFALRQVGPVASALGVTLEQTTGSLSALFNVGLRGEQAGTALRNVMINLVSPAGEAAKVIKTLGLNIYEADGRMRDFYDILRDLSRRNLADADLAALFGREALAGGVALLQSAASGELQQMTDRMTGTQEAVRVALEQMQSFDAQLKQSRNAIDEFRTELGGQMAEAIKPLLGYITDLGIQFRELDPATKSYILTLGTLSAAAAVGVPVLGKLLSAVKDVGVSFIDNASKMVGSARGIYDSLALLSTAPGGLRGNSMRDVFTSLGAAASAAVPLVAGLGAAIVGVGGIAWAFQQARRAYDEANFTQMFGDFEEYGDAVRRNFSNFRQINAANTGTPDYLQGLIAQADAVRDLVEQQQKNITFLEQSREKLNTASANIVQSLTQTTRKAADGTVDIEYYRSLFGVGLGSTREQVSEAVNRVVDERVQTLTEAIKAANPVMAEKFAKAAQEGLDDGFRGSVGMWAQRSPDMADKYINQQIVQIMNDITGGSNFGGIQEQITENVQKIEADIKNITERLGTEYAKINSMDVAPVLETLRKQIFADVPKQLQADFTRRAADATSINDAFVEYVKQLLERSRQGEDITERLKGLAKDYEKSLTDGGAFASGEIANAVAAAASRTSALIFSETTAKMEELAGKAQRDLVKAQRQQAAANGDKSAEKALREMEELEKTVVLLQQEAAQLVKGFERGFEGKQGVSPEMIGLLSGSTIADALDKGGEERKRVEDALQTFAKYQEYIKEEWKKLAMDASWDEYLRANNFTGPDIDPDQLFAASKRLIEVANDGKATADEVNEAFAQLIDYFAANDAAAIAVIKAAGIPIETLNKAQMPQVAAGALMGQFGDRIVSALSTAKVSERVSKAFRESATFVDGVVNAGKALMAGMSEVVNLLGIEGLDTIGADAAATVAGTSTAVDEQLTKSEAQFKRLQDRVNKMRIDIDTGNTKTDNRKTKGSKGRRGKSYEEQKTELEKFLAERNAAILDANLELMEFTGDFDINDYIQLNIKREEANWDTKIADVREKYAKMFDEVRKGTEAIREYKSAMDDASNSSLDNPLGGGGGMALEGGFVQRTEQLLKKFEGIRQSAYYDVNAYRVGFGSDTVTDQMGKISRVTKDTKISVEDALRDLERRITQEFAPAVRQAIGPEAWAALDDNAKAALTSIAYNFGTLPSSVANAAKSMSTTAIAEAIEGLKGLNAGVNDSRRQMEADIVRGASILTEAQRQQYGQLAGLQNQEIALLEKQKQAHMEYAQSAEYSAKMALQGAQSTLDAYIRMNEQTGSFFQGLAAGGQQYVLSMQSNFQTGMETMTQLVNGFTTFGGNMFTDFFTKVATGEEKLGDVLKKNLSQMLLGWGKYFADLAMKYLADWVLRKTLGLFGGGGGGFNAVAGLAFPAAPSFGGGGGSGIGLYAKGGVFDSVTPFANGGIINQRQYFGYGDEKQVGMAGEAGTEAIMPLTRDGRGRLGVIVAGEEGKQASASGVFTYQSNMTFDLRGSDMDENNAQALYQRMDERAQEAARQVIVEERRVGGMLYNGGR